MGAEQGPKENSREDRFIKGKRGRNWTGEVLKRSHHQVNCRIFLKRGINVPLYLDRVLSPKATQSDPQMLIPLNALSSRHPQTARTTAKALRLWPRDALGLKLLHTFRRRRACQSPKLIFLGLMHVFKLKSIGQTITLEATRKAPLWLCGNCKQNR